MVPISICFFPATILFLRLHIIIFFALVLLVNFPCSFHVVMSRPVLRADYGSTLKGPRPLPKSVVLANGADGADVSLANAH